MPKRDDSATVQFKVRMKEVLRSQIEAVAEVNDVTMNSEIVGRLERSLEMDDERERDFDTGFSLRLMKALATAKVLAETMNDGKDAYSDARTAEAAYDAMVGILDMAFSVRPDGPEDRVSPSEGQRLILEDPEARSEGQNIRDVVLESVWDGVGFIEPKLRATVMERLG